MASYRQTGTGEWVVCGTVEEMHLGLMDVRKRDGSTVSENIIRLGKPFQRDGKTYVYGYKVSVPSPSPSQGRGRRTGCACGSIEGEVRASDCWTCRHDNE